MPLSLPRITHIAVPLLIIISVVAVSVVAFLSDGLKRALMLFPIRVKRGEIYRLLTAGWVHADIAHLAVNMFVFYMFADRVVRVFGPILFAAFYVSAVVVAFLPTTLRYRNYPRYASLGASGGVAAVMLSAILLDPRLKVAILFLPIRVPGVLFGIGYIIYSVVRSAGSRDNVNHDAHFSGAVYGALLTFALFPAKVEHTVRVVRHMLGV